MAVRADTYGIDIPTPVHVANGLYPRPCVGLSVGSELVRLDPDEAIALGKWIVERGRIAKRIAAR